MADLQIPNPSITTKVFEYDEAGRVSAISGHPLAGGGGGTVVKSDLMWKPTVESDGYVRWTLASSATTPEEAYISGAQGPAGPRGEQGPQGPSGAKGEAGTKGDKGADATPLTATTATVAGGTQVTISYTSGGDPLAQFNVLSGAQGASGQNGKNGTNGFSPVVSTATTAVDNRDGTVLTFTYGDGGSQTASYTAWNGIDGQGATVNLLEGSGIQITHEAGTTNYTIGVSADYTTKTYVDTVSSTLYNDIEYVDGQVGNKVDKPTSTQTGKLVYDTETSAWSDIGLDGYVPYTAENLAIGSEVFASAYSFAHGWDNSADWNSVAFGTHTSSYNRSLAAGENAIALAHSISIGGGANSHCTLADGQSIAVGNGVRAHNRSIAVGSHSTFADSNALSIGAYCLASGTGSVAIGYENSAYNIMVEGTRGQTVGGQAFGEGLEISGGLAIGYYNATKDAAFVIGNGTGSNSEITRSDLFVIYRDGHVSAAGDIWANGVKLGAGGGTVYDIIGNNGISAKKDTTNSRYEVGLSANVTSQLSKIDSKSTVTSGAGNVFTVNDTTSNPATNFTFSAVNYKAGQTAGYLPQQLFVVASDDEIVSLVNGGAADNKGCLFFRVQ